MDNPALGADVDMACPEGISDCGPKEQFLLKIEGLDVGELINASGRLIDLTKSLNLEDCDKMLPFLMYPIVDDFEKLRAQTCEVKKIYEGYSLDNPFDSLLFRKMQVLAHQLAPRTNASIAYCELKSQLCFEENDFFFELYARVEDRIKACESEVQSAPLLNAICRIRSIYDIYL